MTTNANYLQPNAYHEAGHAIAAWALGLRIHEIAIRDDRPGEHVHAIGDDRLLPLDRVALCSAGRHAAEMFGHLLPPWASTGDRADILRLLAENDIREISEIERCLNNGRVRAHELLRKHEQQVHRLAARLIERRRMSADEFERFMRAVDT